MSIVNEVCAESKREQAPQRKILGGERALHSATPNCGNDCSDPKTDSIMITEDLIGHTVACVECRTESLVPLNAFIRGSTRETLDKRPQQQSREAWSNRETTQEQRRTQSGVVRQPRQLSLDVRTIKTLDEMGINNSELFETLLQQYEPFLNAWAELDYINQEDEEEE